MKNKFLNYKTIVFIALLLNIHSFLYATNYYSGGNNAPNLTASWWTNTNGTGSHPANFTTNGNVFIIQNGHTMTTTANWTVSGTNSTIQINASGILVASNAVTATVMTVNGTYRHNQNGGRIPDATWATASTCEVTGITDNSGAFNRAGLTQAFGNFTWNCTNQTAVVSFAARLSSYWGGSVTGNFTVTSTGTGSIKLVDGNINGNRTLTVSGNYSQGGGTVYVMGSSTRGGVHSMIVNVNGDFSLTGGLLNLSDNDCPGVINAAKNFTCTGSTITETGTNSGAINFNGAGTMQTFTSGATISNTVNFTVNSSAYLQMASAGTTLSGGGSFTLSSGSTLGITSTSGITTSGATGNIQVTGTRTYNAGGKYTYNGTSAQVTGNGLTNANTLTINNSAGVTLSNNVTTSGTLTLTSGTLTTSNSSLLSITNTLTSAISGGSTTSFINGPVKWTLPASLVSGSTYNFPVGKSTTYLPFSLVNPTTGAGTVTAQVEAFASNSGGSANGTTLYSISNTEYWALSSTGNFTNSSVSLTRQSAISPLDAVGGSTTANGAYASLVGTAGTYGVTNSNSIGSYRYFVLAGKLKIMTGTITGSPLCAGSSVNVPYTITGTYISGNTFTAQLSNASGSFASPVNIGSVTSTTAVTITATIPLITSSGTGYRIRVISSNPSITGTDNGTNFTINAAPTVTAGGGTICRGSSTNVTAGGASTYTWSNGLGNGTPKSVSPTTTTTYTVTGTDANSCTNTATAIVTVNALPTVTAGGGTICIGASTNITAGGASTYTWSNGLGNGTPKSVSPTLTTTYTVTGTDINNCTNTATAVVNVNALPTVTAGGGTICRGSSTNITAGGASTYTWSNGLGNGTPKTVNPTITTTYTVTGTDVNSCTNTATAVVTVNAPNVTAGGGTICRGSSINLTAGGASTYTWSNGLGNGTPKSVSPTITTTYTVTGTDATSCTNTANAIVIVNAIPTVTATGGTIYIGNSINISAGGASTYTWSNGLGNGTPKTVNPTTSTTYTVTGTDANSCTNSANAVVIVTTLHLDCWHYRKSHVINPATDAGTNYQVQVTVHYGSGTDGSGDVYCNSQSNADFSDIRFTTSDGTTLLSHWKQSYTSSSIAVFWVKIPSDLSSSSQTIYIYYGNAAATDISSGTNTFINYDDGSSTSGWTTVGTVGSSATVGNPVNSLYAQTKTGSGTGGDGQYYMYKNISGFGPNTFTFFNVRTETGNLGNFYFQCNSSGAGQMYRLDSRGSTNYTGFATTTAWNTWAPPAGTQTSSANTWYQFGIAINSTGTSTKLYYNSGTSTNPVLGTLLGTYTSVNNGSYVALGGDAVGGTMNTYWDNIITRKYVNPEPSHSTWGSEEYLGVYTWNGTTSDWQVATNWTPSRTDPASCDILQFNGGVGGTITNVPTQTIAELNISGNTTVNLQSASSSNNLTITEALTTTANDVLNFGSGVILAGTLTTLTNSGTIQTAVPTASSATPLSSGKIWGGTVEFNNSSANQTIVAGTYNNLTISGNSIKTLATSTTINAALSVKAGATLNLSTFNLGTPTSVVLETGTTGATISGTGTLTLGGNVTVNATTGNSGVTISTPIALNGTTRTFTVADEGTSANDLTISGIISGTVGITKAGAGTLLLSNSNTYSGLTTINAGIIKLGTAGGGTNTPLGTTGAGTTVTAGALDLNGFTLGTAEALTLNGTGISNGGALTNSSATNVNYSGLISLGSASRIITNAGDINLTNTGNITGNTFGLTFGGSGNGSIASNINTTTGTITKIGTGTWTISGNSNYTGLTTISEGTLKLGAAGGGTNTPLGTTGSGTSVTSGAALDLNGFTLGTAEALSLNGTGISNRGALTNSSVTAATYSGVITFATDASIVGDAGTIAITGTPVSGTTDITLGGTAGGSISTVVAGARTMIKEGSGTWTLSGNNTFSGGLIINEGTIQLGNNNRLAGTLPFTMNGGTFKTGATTGYDETTGTLTLTDNSTIAFGTGKHQLHFAASNGTPWTTGKALTIIGWTGNWNGTSGTAGELYFGNSTSGLTASQLTQIRFYNGSAYFPAIILSTGEVVPTGNYITTRTISGSPFCAGTSGINVPFTYALASNYPVGTTTFTAQLSSSTGSFTSPTNLQSITSDISGSQSISVTIPIGTATGTGYRIRIVSNNPAINGTDNGTNLTINAAPTVTAGGGGAICRGSSTNISASGASTYTWSNGLGSGTPKTVNPTISTTYTVTGTNASSCTNTASVIVTVNAPNVTAGGATICNGSSANLTAGGASTYTWSNGLGNGTPKTVNPTISTTYTVTGTDASSCTNTATAVVTVNSLPTVTAGGGTICNGSSTNITAGGASTYAWSNGLGSGTPKTVNPTVSTTYTVTGTDGNNCSNTANAVVTVNALPAVTAGGGTICNGASQNITAGGASTYTWSNGLGSGTPKTVNPTVSTTYTVTGTDGNNCSNTANAVVIVNALPTVTAGGGTICNGASQTLTAGGANTYAWSNGLGSGTPKTVNPTVSSTYTVTGTDGNNCSNTANAVVTVNDVPTANAGNKQITCSGVNVTLNASGGGSYSWSSGSTSSSTTVSPAVTTTYTVTVSNGYSCTASSSVLVVVASTVYSNNSGSWADNNSWDQTIVPAPCNDVIISNGHVIDITSLAGSCNNLTVLGTLNIDGASSLTSTGKITNGSTGIINITGSISGSSYNFSTSGNTIVYNNTTDDQAVIPVKYYNLTIDKPGYTATMSSNDTVNGNLTINGSLQSTTQNLFIGGDFTNNGTFNHNNGKVIFNGASVYNGSSITTFNNVDIAPGKLFTIQGGGKTMRVLNKLILMASGPSNMAQLAIEDNDSQLTGAGGNDSVFVQIYDTLDNWHYVSAPIDSGYMGAMVYKYFYGKLYNETKNIYEWYNGKFPLVAGRGFTIKWNSSYINPNTGLPVRPSDRLVTIPAKISKLHTGTIAYPITYTSGFGDGWNLVGNPYPCSIDWEATEGWDNTNIEPTIYVYDAQHYRYATYNSNTHVGTNGGTRYIPSQQGLYIHCTDDAVWSMDNRVRIAYNQPFWKGANTNQTNQLTENMFNIMISGNGYTDESMIGFKTDAGKGFDKNFDAYKLLSPEEIIPQINTTTLDGNNVKVAVNFLPQELINKSTVPLQFNVGQAGTFTITANNGMFDPTVNVTLEDIRTGKMTDLRTSTYTFSSEAVSNDNRFLIHFGDAPTSIKESNLNEMIKIYSNQNYIFIQNSLTNNEKGTITIFDMVGKEINSRELTPNSLISIEMNDEAGSIYLVRIVQGNKTFTKKLCITK